MDLRDFYHKTITTGFGSGLVPFAPGTFGSLLAAFIVWGLATSMSTYLLAGLILVFYVLGTLSIPYVEKQWGKDPSAVVVDEFVGQWIAFLFVPLSWQTILLGFVLFRLFDITKVLGVGRLEKVSSPHGVMLDDVLAGVYANMVLQVVLWMGWI